MTRGSLRETSKRWEIRCRGVKVPDMTYDLWIDMGRRSLASQQLRQRERIAIKETREFDERRDANVNRLSDEIHANRGEVTCAVDRPQAIGAECVPFKLDWCTAWVNAERLCKCPITQVRHHCPLRCGDGAELQLLQRL